MRLRDKKGILLNRPASSSKQHGVYALMLVLLLIPLIAMVGFAVDYARMVQYKSDLQNAVDEAALAGASVYTSNTSTISATAISVATQYFNHAILPPALVVGPPTVSTNARGTLNAAQGGGVAFTVTVSATATVGNTFFSLFVPSATVSASGTAGDPIITSMIKFSNVNSQACDGNTAYLYQVPKSADGLGYDYGAVPPFSSDNYYWIGSSIASTAPGAQTLPTFGANQPLGMALLNTTNGNAVDSNTYCGVTVTGANSYGSPNQGSQMFYSSLLLNGESPSENSNASYTVVIQTTQNTSHHSGRAPQITQVTLTPPAAPGQTPQQIVYPSSNYPLAQAPYNIQASYTGGADCTITGTSAPVINGSSETVDTTYSCTTQYRKQASNPSTYAANCSLYIQTGVSQSYIDGLTNNSPAPAGIIGQCSTTSGGGAQYAAPSCAQLSALANTGAAPAAVFWWDDAGGVGPQENYYGPSDHCAQISPGSPGYGEDCEYKNNFFAAECQVEGGTTSGYTEVVLTQ